MTKQPPSATKLQLSRLFRWLAVLCFMKLTILGLLLLDLRPAQRPDNAPQEKTSELTAPSEDANALQDARLTAPQELSQAVQPAPVNPTPQESSAAQRPQASPPQGSAAASLAAEAKPHGSRKPLADASLPAPLIRSGASAATEGPAALAFTLSLPEPQPLPAPQAEPGTNAPRPALLLASDHGRKAAENGWLDALGIRRLPIPSLGSVQAAHAAALDMPVPQTPASQSPFMPAEQTAPLALPGAPPLPPGIAYGQSADGAPLPPRSAAGADGPVLPSLPRSAPPPLATAPVPAVRPAPSSDVDPQVKTQELARQQQDILVLRQQMDQRLKDIQNAEQKMKDMIREARGLEDDKVRRLVLTYTQMKPKAAAKALENMEERVAIRILSGMSPKQSGDILTYVNPAKTAKLTELITRMRLPE